MRARPHRPAAAAMARPSAGHSNSLRHRPWRSPKVSAATPCPSSRTPRNGAYFLHVTGIAVNLKAMPILSHVPPVKPFEMWY
uniref:Uncharacterized protein n=1 Tax=Oryza meridionalis TaxID=40149 RepID=A0A0E0D344_9ORYZ